MDVISTSANGHLHERQSSAAVRSVQAPIASTASVNDRTDKVEVSGVTAEDVASGRSSKERSRRSTVVVIQSVPAKGERDRFTQHSILSPTIRYEASTSYPMLPLAMVGNEAKPDHLFCVLTTALTELEFCSE
jgi:hypothetical protein